MKRRLKRDATMELLVEITGKEDAQVSRLDGSKELIFVVSAGHIKRGPEPFLAFIYLKEDESWNQN